MSNRSKRPAAKGSSTLLDQYARRYKIKDRPPREGKSMRECTAICPEIDGESLLRTLHSVNTAITSACLSKGRFFTDDSHEKQHAVQPKKIKPGDLRHLMRRTRADMSLFEPLDGIIVMLQDARSRVNNWSARTRYFKVCTVPAYDRLPRAASTLEAEADIVSQARSLLHRNGHLDKNYIQSFDVLTKSLVDPTFELRFLLDLLGSIIDCGTGQICSITYRTTSHTLQSASVKPEATPVSLDSSAGHIEQVIAADDRHGKKAVRDPPDSTVVHTEKARTTDDRHGKKEARFSHDPAPVHDHPKHHQAQPSAHPTKLHALPPLTPRASNPVNHAAATEAASASYYWKTNLTARGHPAEQLTVHPHDISIYDRAWNLARIALREAEFLIGVCQHNKEEAEALGVVWQARMDVVDKREKEIERAIRAVHDHGMAGAGDAWGWL